MSDVRSLLRAKREEARINHPLAAYNASGQLRCIICSTVIKHASAWQGHLGSKAHRMNVAREKEAEKRKREAEEVMEEDEQGLEEEVEEVASKKPRLEAQPEPTGNFPADFFSDPSRKLPSASQSDDEDDAEEAPASKAAPMTLDEEYALFTEAVVNTSHQEIYQAATISAEAQLAEETPEGFPTQQQEEVVEKVEEETEEQKRLRLKQEEHELIMDRIIEEERAQEEADMKVATMKAKLEALRQKRLKKTQS